MGRREWPRRSRLRTLAFAAWPRVRRARGPARRRRRGRHGAAVAERPPQRRPQRQRPAAAAPAGRRDEGRARAVHDPAGEELPPGDRRAAPRRSAPGLRRRARIRRHRSGARHQRRRPHPRDPQRGAGRCAAGSVPPYSFQDFERRAPMLWLAILFAGLVLLFGRVRGAHVARRPGDLAGHRREIHPASDPRRPRPGPRRRRRRAGGDAHHDRTRPRRGPEEHRGHAGHGGKPRHHPGARGDIHRPGPPHRPVVRGVQPAHHRARTTSTCRGLCSPGW